MMNPQHFAAYSAAWAYREAVHEALTILRPHLATLENVGAADAFEILANTEESQNHNIDVMSRRNHG